MAQPRRGTILGATIVAGLALVAVAAATISLMRPDATVLTSAAPYVESARTIAAANAGVVGVVPLRVDEVRCGANSGDFAFAFGNPLGRAFAIVDGGPPAQQTDPPETMMGVVPATAAEFSAFAATPCE